MFIPPKIFDFRKYKHLSFIEKALVAFPLHLSHEKSCECLRYRIADTKKESAETLLSNTQHRQYRIIAQCHFLRRNHSNIHLPTHTIYLLRQNDFRLHTRYA